MKVGCAGEEALECHPGFQTRERRTKAEMDPPPETDVLTWRGTIQTDLVRRIEAMGVAIGGWPHEHEAGVGRFVEVGPGGVLSGLARRAIPGIDLATVATEDDADAVAGPARNGHREDDVVTLEGPGAVAASPRGGRS